MKKVVIVIVIIAIVIVAGISLLQDRKEKTEPLSTIEPEVTGTELTPEHLSITVVYDNNPYTEGLITDWGFSCFIRGTEKTILFDTGGDGALLLDNMKKLNIAPEEIDIIVISHIHGDHTGGLFDILKENGDVTCYLPQSFPSSYRENAQGYGATVIEVSEPVQICSQVYSTGEMGISIKEQSLVIETEKGSIVITGCAHPGIVQIVEQAKTMVEDDILFVMGGFHLGGASTARLQGIISQFRNLGVKYVGPCHCSGDTARELFEQEYGINFILVGLGKVITIHDLL
jgi:7,8-dihydropterin-6-yl-methyl-4-(beta-D-ribofuranosyl)aminobenzene 5'-phosphate synthase